MNYHKYDEFLASAAQPEPKWLDYFEAMGIKKGVKA